MANNRNVYEQDNLFGEKIFENIIRFDLESIKQFVSAVEDIQQNKEAI